MLVRPVPVLVRGHRRRLRAVTHNDPAEHVGVVAVDGRRDGRWRPVDDGRCVELDTVHFGLCRHALAVVIVRVPGVLHRRARRRRGRRHRRRRRNGIVVVRLGRHPGGGRRRRRVVALRSHNFRFGSARAQ